MIRAFGYCNDTVDTASPGRLCRGRERWLEGLPDATRSTVFRTVLSGATFSDDSARDARRGYPFGGVSAGSVLQAVFPGCRVLGFCHGGDPLALPGSRELEEDWTYLRFGGVTESPAVRWVAEATGDAIDGMIVGEREGLAIPRAEGFVVLREDDELSDELIDALYHLNGFANPDAQPPELYAATALPEVLEHCVAVVLFHLDKHGPALAIYTLDPLERDEELRQAALSVGSFPVPFAIPPMLARWDRALYELRLDWDTQRDGEFPVPPADDAGGRWSSRGRRFHDRRDRDDSGPMHGDPESGPSGEPGEEVEE
jgi:hypothetical protein